MNAIIENLLTRRSTRAFLQREIPDNELNEILQAAIYAPSGMGKQTWKFTVLCNCLLYTSIDTEISLSYKLEAVICFCILKIRFYIAVF